MTKQKTYDRIAGLYDLLDMPFEYFRYRPIRGQLFAGLSGELLDAGVGTGRNIPYYPAGTQVTGIDLSAAMLARAQRRRAALGHSVALHQMDVLDLDFDGHRFDAVVSTFMFCVLEGEHQLPALRELRRVCRPGGCIRILEYALSENPARRAVMKLWAPWVRFAYGADFDRQTEQYLEAAGLELVEKRFLKHDVIKMLTIRPKGD